MSVFEGPLEPSSTASAANDSTEDSSFENFFSVSALLLCLFSRVIFHVHTVENCSLDFILCLPINILVNSAMVPFRIPFVSLILYMVGSFQTCMFSTENYQSHA
jgi:hypothetical protein